MEGKNMTPDELAAHLHKIAQENGAALTQLEFTTHRVADNVIGRHSYSGTVIEVHGQPPRSMLIGD